MTNCYMKVALTLIYFSDFDTTARVGGVAQH